MTTQASSPDEASFERFQSTRARVDRDALVLQHEQLARVLARRFQHRGEPLDDLYQVALVGLVKAVERFDPSLGYAFSTFATPTILGELKRYFRGQWTVRVPRSLQEATLDLNAAVTELSQSLGRSPAISELAQHTGRSEEEILEAMEAGRAFRPVALERPSSEDADTTILDTLGERDPGQGSIEQRLVADRLLASLGQREQTILRLRFFEGLTQSEIGDRLGISQMHVSRLITKSLDQLRAIADLEFQDLEA
jgi:RNA polymerase sigma-B factor